MTFRPLGVMLALVLGVSTAGAAAWAAAGTPSPADTLADDTVIDRWTLPNGLAVETRHIPGAGAVSITVGYRAGFEMDAPGQEGLAQLMGMIQFTAAAGDIPARSVSDLDSQRPMGWSFPVSRRSTLLSESATVEQFPGVLAQVATRMRGVRFDEGELNEAVARVREELAQAFFGPPEISLYHQVREVGLGRTDEEILRRAAGKSVTRISSQDLRKALDRTYVPANAALSVIGNLDGLDVRTLIAKLFGDIPGGTRAEWSPVSLKPRSRLLLREDIPGSAAAVGILAPALDDTLHPSFHMNMLLLGNHCAQEWKRRGEFPAHQYAIFDEPDLVRFYPPTGATNRDVESLRSALAQAIEILNTAIIPKQVYEQLYEQNAWKLGGPMPPSVARQARSNPYLLLTLSRSAAARTLWEGAAFWETYRARFETIGSGFQPWGVHALVPHNQVLLLMAPRKK